MLIAIAVHLLIQVPVLFWLLANGRPSHVFFCTGVAFAALINLTFHFVHTLSVERRHTARQQAEAQYEAAVWAPGVVVWQPRTHLGALTKKKTARWFSC